MDDKSSAEEKYENSGHDIGKMFKYFKLLIIVSFSFVMMYIENLEWIGILFGAAVNEVIITYVALDYSDSPKHHDMIVFLLELFLKFKILAEYLMFVLYVDLQRKYTDIGSPIQLSRESRHKVDDYKKLFIINTILLYVVTFVFCTSYRTEYGEKVEEDTYLEFFYPFSVIDNDIKTKFGEPGNNPDTIIRIMIYKVFCYVWYFIKIILVLIYGYSTLIMSIAAEELVVVNTTRLYIAETNDGNQDPKSVPYKTGSLSGFVNDVVSNINLNYLMNYN